MVRQRLSEDWITLVKRAIIAATIFSGSLLPARANNAVYADRGHRSESPHIVSKACLNTHAVETNGSVTTRNAAQCWRGGGRRRVAGTMPSDNELVCVVDVLYSEELTGAPIFYHFVRATLRITQPRSPAFEAVVTKMIHWQVPPPRQGQRLRLRCDAANLSYFVSH